ncbi:MAG TPA: hypothetical protein PKK23_06660 [Nitrospirales bacterium]|nr:hypothetical protein [Nitrospirales bacterium]HNP28706.1 hypothetical protein [Nitrospirales bacterium]
MTRGHQTVPFNTGDVRRMRAVRPDISERTVCRLLQGSRSALHRPDKGKRACATLAEALVAKLEPLIQAYPTYGYRRLWALL